MGHNPSKKKNSVGKVKHPWELLADDAILNVRLCDLKLKLKGSWLERPVENLRGELADRELVLKPHIWLSDDWFCPDGTTGFAAPFFLAHPRLIKLERKHLLEAEGSNFPWCMKLLRHETGHVLQNAYQLHRRKKWRELFGKSSLPYPTTYRPRPLSKNYVLNLYNWYAQSHPAEDFAETFAVWLKPGRKWKTRYRGWPAIRKLEYVDELMAELMGVGPKKRSRAQVDPLSKLKKTLGEYFSEKQARYGTSHPDIYDRDLVRLFSNDSAHASHETASAFLRRHRREIRRQVAKWTGEYAFTIDQVFNYMIGRSRELDLKMVGLEKEVRVDFAILLTVRTMQYLHTRRERIPV
ncbi:MAG: putative zinc-binding metallopeptidase [Myxococcota bacterium]|nr:putative zinc-binding metallopeptidase [Myxococcota bacterium]